MPPALLSAIRGEFVHLEGRTDTVRVELWVVKGQPVEARVRGRESVHVVSLSS